MHLFEFWPMGILNASRNKKSLTESLMIQIIKMWEPSESQDHSLKTLLCHFVVKVAFFEEKFKILGELSCSLSEFWPMGILNASRNKKLFT